MPRGLVLVDQAFALGLVDNDNGFLVSGLRGGLVTTGDGGLDLLHGSAEAGTQGRILLTVVFRLAGAFFRLCCIGQRNLLKIGSWFFKAAYYGRFAPPPQPAAQRFCPLGAGFCFRSAG